jgi:hypothetical protein
MGTYFGSQEKERACLDLIRCVLALADSSVVHSLQLCRVRYTHSGNYEARGASGDYEARGASGNYEAWRASGGKYEARMMIFRILAAVNRFSRISRKEESR